VLAEIFTPDKSDHTLPPGHLQLGTIGSPADPIDQALVARTTYGAEINLHGGPAVVAETLRRLTDLGVRVLSAPTVGMYGLGVCHPAWDNPSIGRELLEALPGAATARVAAALTHQWSAGVSELASMDHPSGASLQQAGEGLAVMQRLLQPAEVVLVGPPNAGKSSLANILVGRDVSIVHRQRGTTRDWIREIATPMGLPVWLTDTAGIWSPPDSAHHVDRQAVLRARQRAQQADLVVLVEAEQDLPSPHWLAGRNLLRVSAKCDIHPPAPHADVAVSSQTGRGLDELRQAILDRLGLGGFDPSTPRAFTPRQADLLEKAADAATSGKQDTSDKLLTELLGR
jgi:tRNA modification GTPase